MFNKAYDMASSSNSEENKKLPPLEKLPDVVEEPKPVYKEVWVFFLSVRDKYIFYTAWILWKVASPYASHTAIECVQRVPIVLYRHRASVLLFELVTKLY